MAEQRLDVEAVAELVGDRVVELAARRAVRSWRQIAERGSASDHGEAGWMIAPLAATFASATADLVEVLVDTEGGVDGLIAAEGLGVNVQPILEASLAVAAGRVAS